MKDLNEMKRRSIEAEREEKELFRRLNISDEDFPCFFTEEVLEMLAISQATLYRIRRHLNAKCPEHASHKPGQGTRAWKNRYSAREIREIKAYITPMVHSLEITGRRSEKEKGRNILSCVLLKCFYPSPEC